MQPGIGAPRTHIEKMAFHTYRRPAKTDIFLVLPDFTKTSLPQVPHRPGLPHDNIVADIILAQNGNQGVADILRNYGGTSVRLLPYHTNYTSKQR
jgi:hypothetical protein